MNDLHTLNNWGLNVDWILRDLLTQGLSRTDIGKAIDRKLIAGPGNYLPIDTYLLLIAWSAEQLNSPNLGINIADRLNTQCLGIYGCLLENAPTVRSFCEHTEQYQKIIMTGMEFSFRYDSDSFTARWQIYRPPCEGVRHDVEYTLAAFVKLLQNALGDKLEPIQANFRHARNTALEPYRKVFGHNINFVQAENSLTFSNEILDFPLRDSDPKLLNIHEALANNILNELGSEQSLIGYTKYLIATFISHKDSSIERVADYLHITSRTLHRHLRQQGSSYRQLREQIMVDLAKQFLSSSNANMTEIAGKLGYSEASAFLRAFKKITGFSPCQYRKKVR